MKDIIEIKDLSKSFGEVKAVDGLSFNVKEGELFAFLGISRGVLLHASCALSRRICL